MKFLPSPPSNDLSLFLPRVERQGAVTITGPVRLLLFIIAVGLASHLGVSSVAAQDKKAKTPAVKQKAKSEKPAKPAWKPLFDGKTLKDWKITNFGGQGEVIVEKGVIEMWMGSSMTGINYLQKMPKCDYEVQVEAMRIDGVDFFSTITFPVNDSYCSLVVGGWAGPVVGLSCVDHADASENETTTYQKFESNKWYRIRVRVRRDHISAWIDDKQVVDLDTKGRKLSTRTEVSLSEPFGITCWETTAGIRKIELRELPPPTPKK